MTKEQQMLESIKRYVKDMLLFTDNRKNTLDVNTPAHEYMQGVEQGYKNVNELITGLEELYK